jgi:putative methyltransferase
MQNVALVQVNYRFGNNVFLPHSAGLIRAYCESIPEIADNFKFLDFVYLREDPTEIAQRLDAPKIVGISCYMWNWEWSKKLAEQVKTFHPDCLVVLGGPQVPAQPQDFFESTPYVDLVVHYEGEITFSEILREHLRANPDYSQVDGISVRGQDGQHIQTPGRARTQDLEVLPSPYVAGCFDYLMSETYDFHASQETHRGCPYSCTFCDWGSAVFTKIRQFSDERLYSELEWFGKNQIELLYNCDANFGLLNRDLALTQKMAETKKAFGFPQQFRAAYAKNSNLKVLEIAKILNDSGMNKGVTLSFQSMDDRTLEAIKRTNIKVQNLKELVGLYREEGIPTYSEIIMALPGETYESFADGIQKILEAGQHDGLNIYVCIVIPNSELADPAYIAEHGIKSVRMPVLLAHSSPSEDPIVEYYDIVVETKSLPQKDFKRIYLYSWIVQLGHCLGLTQYLALYSRHRGNISYKTFYESLLEFGRQHPETLMGQEVQSVSEVLDGAVQGGDWGVVLPRFGEIVWPTEEASFLNLVCDKRRFYEEISQFLDSLLSENGVAKSTAEHDLSELVLYQEKMIIDPHTQPVTNLDLEFDFHGYFDSAYKGAASELKKNPNRLTITSDATFQGDLESYARTIVWYGRKANKFRHSDVRVELLGVLPASQ